MKRTTIVLGLLVLASAIYMAWFAWRRDRGNEASLRPFKPGPPMSKSVTRPSLQINWNNGGMLAPDGRIYNWGGNNFGLGGSGISQFPQPIGRDTNWVELAYGNYLGAYARKRDSTLWRLLPGKTDFQLFDTNAWRKLAVGGNHCVFLRADGTVWAVGQNNYGQLGVPPTATVTISNLVAVPLPGKFVDVACSSFSNYAISEEGVVWHWGLSATNMANSVDAPAALGTNRWRKIVASDYTAFGLQADGSLWIHGRNASVYTRAPALTNVFVSVSPDLDWEDIQVNGNMALAKKSDGSWWLAGQNLGTKYLHSTQTAGFTKIFQKVEPAYPFIAWGASYETFLFMTEDGNLWSLGGRLGTDRGSSAKAFVRNFHEILGKSSSSQSAKTLDKTPYWLWGPKD